MPTSRESRACADQGFSSVGVKALLTEKGSDDFLLVLVFNEFYRWGLMVYSKETIIFQGSRGVQHFPEGQIYFPGWSQLLSPMETYKTCDFPGLGGSGPLSPLDPGHYRPTRETPSSG